MCECTESFIQCPRCGSQMINGSLRGSGGIIHVESVSSLKDSPLWALICPACGHVELQASHPENLIRHDISDEELDSFLGSDF